MITSTHDRWVQRVEASDVCHRITDTLMLLCSAYGFSDLDIARGTGIAIGSLKSLFECRRFPTIADLDAFGQLLGVPGSDILRAAEATS